MSDSDLRSFVARSRALIDSSPPTTLGETRAWLVGPFLETLGWDVHGDSCATDRTLEGTRLEYVCSVHEVPALFVAVDPFGESLDRSRAVALLETMAWTGVDRGIYTDGGDFLLLAGTTDAERHACRLASLPDHESAVAHYSRPAVGQHLQANSRESIARQLALERPALVDAIVAELTSATDQGTTYETEFESAADRFLEQLVVTFGDDGCDRFVAERQTDAGPDVAVAFSETEISSDDRSAGRRSESKTDGRPQRAPGERAPSEAGAPPDATDGDSSATEADPGGADADSSATDADPTGAETRPNATDGSEPAGDSVTETASSPAGDGVNRSGDHAADPADGSGDGEYVVRFFNERGSIGAIGHSSSKHALVEAAEYLFDRGLSGVAVPWSPDDTDDARAVLNDSPTNADGSAMADPQHLSNGLYLETSGDDEGRAERVEALVARAGLRAMLTGDWG